MSTDVPEFSLDDLYDLAHVARRENPHDGRTREGRAWLRGAWAVYLAACETHDADKAGGVL